MCQNLLRVTPGRGRVGSEGGGFNEASGPRFKFTFGVMVAFISRHVFGIPHIDTVRQRRIMT